MSDNTDQSEWPPAAAAAIGIDVHHVGRGSADGHYAPEIRPGKIVSLGRRDAADLVVWTREGQFWAHDAPFHAGDPAETPPFSPYYRCPITGLAYPGGTWHWPPEAGS